MFFADFWEKNKKFEKKIEKIFSQGGPYVNLLIFVILSKMRNCSKTVNTLEDATIFKWSANMSAMIVSLRFL